MNSLIIDLRNKDKEHESDLENKNIEIHKLININSELNKKNYILLKENNCINYKEFEIKDQKNINYYITKIKELENSIEILNIKNNENEIKLKNFEELTKNLNNYNESISLIEKTVEDKNKEINTLLHNNNELYNKLLVEISENKSNTKK
jgi:hypothetical protein